jgi:GTP-binding protein EngB required for normal cell division/tetratricopeptide (TPR) repeat protein
MSETPPGSRKPTLGDALGGWARRVGGLFAEVSGSVTLPEGLREGLERARSLRLAGASDAAQGVLRALPAELLDNPHVRFAFGLAHVHDGLRGHKPLRALAEIVDEIGDQLGAAPAQVLRAAHALFDGRPDAALDDLRRAARDTGRLLEGEAIETRFLAHLLASQAHFALGHEERTLRELMKARARLPAEAGLHLRNLVLVRGVDLLLGADLLDDAEAWVREATQQDPHDREAAELRVRVAAAKGDREAALALLDPLVKLDDDSTDETRLFVALTVGLPEPSSRHADKAGDPRTLAMRALQRAPEDPRARRRWALAELRRLSDDREARLDEAVAREVVDALADATEAAPRGTKDGHLQELAHAMLRLECFSDRARALVETRLRTDEGTAPEELRLVRARREIAAGRADEAAKDFVGGDPQQFRADPDIGGPWGPDPLSPVRSADLRTALLASQRSLAGAELALAKDDDETAQDLLVAALVEWPGLPHARERLAKLVHSPAGGRLEDLLTAATRLLAAVPSRVLGVPMTGVAEALAQVIAARERLVRPLTIAIMGEFSAGKSTFVNALLGEAVAPMGVLPTTTTINVFRRGPGGGARVHYRDGRISTLAPDEVQKFLHSLDTTAAARIRHVEIERVGGRMGDAAVVDTPGLNALDPFHEQVAREFLDEADAVVWLFSATRSGAASEVGMLASLRASGRQVLGVLNKVDTLDAPEQAELAKYLRDQLGEVLVDVVPVRAREALEFRTAGKTGAGDPFAAVEESLERNFLQRARELKRSLTARRLSEALDSARAAVRSAVEALQSRATAAAGAEDRTRASVPAILGRFADAIAAGLLDVDDLLVREGLGLGVLRTGKGAQRGPLDPQDAAYLSAVMRDGALAALQRALVAVAREDAAASEVLDREFVPWAQGHLVGLVEAGFVERAILEHGGRITDGETAAREALRLALAPLAAAWSERARNLVRAVERARARHGRSSTSAPLAEALRLRATVLASLDALATAVEESHE